MNEKELIENLVYPDTMYRKQIEELENQLATYKQKEDKLRKYIGENTFYRDNLDNQIYVNYEHNTDRTSMVESDNILQILNEGDK